MTTGTLYLLPNLISASDPEASLPAGVLERARHIDYFLVEAAKTARSDIRRLGHPKPIAELTIVEIGHEPDPAQIDAWLEPLLEGKDAAILSESGCPGVADPGAQLVARAQTLRIRVVPLVGPSSILLTLMASGLNGQRFRFTGYLPVHETERRDAILMLQKESAGADETILFIETPYRNSVMLESLAAALSPDTRLTVATDVTGPRESIRTRPVAEWRTLTEEERALPKLPTVFAFLAAPPGTGKRTASEKKSAQQKKRPVPRRRERPKT